MNRPLKRYLTLTAVVMTAAAVFIVAGRSGPDNAADLESARRLLLAGDYEQAEKLAGRVVERGDDQHRNAAVLLAGRAAERRHDSPMALEWYAKSHHDQTPNQRRILNRMADINGRLGRLSDAEANYRDVLTVWPDDPQALDGYSVVLTISGRRRESHHVLRRLVAQGGARPEQLWMLTEARRSVATRELLNRCRDENPDDPLPLLGLAHLAINDKDYDQAIELLDMAIASRPRLVEAHAKRGFALVSSGRIDAMSDWERALPDDADDHPGIWMARGLWARDRNDPPQAARCFYVALQRDPNSEAALIQAANAFAKLGQNELVRVLRERQQDIEKLIDLVDQIHRDPGGNMEAIRHASEIAEQLGDDLLARAWSRLALEADPSLEWARHLARRTGAIAGSTDGTGSLTTAFLREHDAELQQLLPEWQPGRHTATDDKPEVAQVAAVTFRDVAVQAGLKFTYTHRDPALKTGLFIHQQIGGGVGVLDFDRDTWPDLYFSQGTTAPLAGESETDSDVLFRNIGGRAFEAVTQTTGVTDSRYSHGVAVGDFDNDGFPDLRIGNHGSNALLRNNGDGTFQRVDEHIDGDTAIWTSSCAVADLNGDGNPELFDVNYLRPGPERGFDAECEQGIDSSSCGPADFPAAQDQLFLNTGDGRFVAVGQSSGVTAPLGKGLGIVVAGIAGAERPMVLVANDGEANHVYVNQAATGATPRFAERAYALGLAVDRDGRRQACMGIAAGDPDHDGLLDFFVTNFANESNTLYHQLDGGGFEDATVASRLHDSGLPMLGFGTQFIDADLDGSEDLIATNGHVDDLSDRGQAFRMRPQYFHNDGTGRFVELSGDEVGPHFRIEQLGRGLAVLDWNRDGRPDAAVSHLDTPAALLENTTDDVGHRLTVRLVGTRASRDAVGSVVTIEAAGFRRMKQRTAGDGYCSSNQAQLNFGLGARETIDSLRVRWPSGREQEYGPVTEVDVELVVVEGHEAAVVVRH